MKAEKRQKCLYHHVACKHIADTVFHAPVSPHGNEAVRRLLRLLQLLIMLLWLLQIHQDVESEHE